MLFRLTGILGTEPFIGDYRNEQSKIKQQTEENKTVSLRSDFYKPIFFKHVVTIKAILKFAN